MLRSGARRRAGRRGAKSWPGPPKPSLARRCQELPDVFLSKPGAAGIYLSIPLSINLFNF